MHRTPLELYVACRDRSARAFVEAFVPAPREVSIVRPHPEPSDAPQPMADVDELLRHLETGSSTGYSFSWINALPEQEHHQATFLYTEDSTLVAGLAGTFADEAKALATLAAVVGGHFGTSP